MKKNQSKIQIAVLVVLIIVFVGFIYQTISQSNQSNKSEFNEQQEISNIYDSNQYFLTKLPQGFDKIADQQFLQSTKQDLLSVYFDPKSGDYFEISVNEQPTDAKVNEVWTYSYDPSNKKIIIDSKNACSLTSYYKCSESSGDRFDIAIIPNNSSKQTAPLNMTFRFGNIKMNSGNLNYAENFLENIKINI